MSNEKVDYTGTYIVKIDKLEKEIEILTNDLEREKSQVKEYGTRLIKAIEYIENCSGIYTNAIGEKKQMVTSQNLLNILQGSDKE